MSQKKKRGIPPSQRQSRSSELYPNDIKFVAVHEAGHAVAAVVLGLELRKVDIKRRRMPDGTRSLGFTDTPPVDIDEVLGKGPASISQMICGIAGPVAELLWNPALLEDGGATGDFADARICAVASFCEPSYGDREEMIFSPEQQEKHAAKISALAEDAIEGAYRLVEKNLKAIVEVANLLIIRKELSGDEVAAIVNREAEAQAASV
jgi:ATP-dependent Zn protease